MTLILDLDLDVLKMYLHTNSEVCALRHSKSQSPNRTHRQALFFDPVTFTLIRYP